MTQLNANAQTVPTPTDTPPPADSSGQMLALARQATARIITAALEATAEAADMEQAARRRFGALSSLAAPMQVDPQQIRDFTGGRAYRELIDDYVAGRVEGHLLARVLDLLGRFLPVLLAR